MPRRMPAGFHRSCWASTRRLYHTSAVELLAQGWPSVLLLREAPPLQLRHHELDELAHVVHRGIAAAQDEAAIGAGLEVHPLELVDDRFGRAGRNQNAIDQKTLPELLQ